jgi:hypothetical protein
MIVYGMKKINKFANAQKQQFGNPSLQASLRCQTLAFYPTHGVPWIV